MQKRASCRQCCRATTIYLSSPKADSAKEEKRKGTITPEHHRHKASYNTAKLHIMQSCTKLNKYSKSFEKSAPLVGV